MKNLRRSHNWFMVGVKVVPVLTIGTADGSLTTVVAVKPARFKRLQLVADQLTRNAQHTAGLNPKAFR